MLKPGKTRDDNEAGESRDRCEDLAKPAKCAHLSDGGRIAKQCDHPDCDLPGKTVVDAARQHPFDHLQDLQPDRRVFRLSGIGQPIREPLEPRSGPALCDGGDGNNRQCCRYGEQDACQPAEAPQILQNGDMLDLIELLMQG